MKRGFRLKLLFIMIVFATTIAFTSATIDQYRFTAQLEENNLFQIEEIESALALSLQTIDKVYYFFDADTAEKMKASSKYLLDLYDRTPNFDKWDFKELKDRFGMDIYIINEENVITHSSLKRDVGIDFDECCHTLAKILNERRQTGEFYHDGMDIDQGSGEITKYSYMATNDKKHLIELGFKLEDGPIFKEFNFLKTSKEMVDRYPLVNEITVFNIGGLPFGKSSESEALSGERRQAFKETLHSGEIVEIKDDWNGVSSVYRYVPITSEYDIGQTKDKVIEIVYNDTELQAVLKQSWQTFSLKLVIILIVTFILSLFISKLVSKPMHMAFHDSLTGLKNRGAFEEMLSKELRKQDNSIALLMIDLDNFKLVNDYFGHDYGDELLKHVGNNLKSTITKNAEVFRLGGDEFAIILLDTCPIKAEQLAEQILDCLEYSFTDNQVYKNVEITASIGIAMVQGNDEDVDSLYKKADIAMYQSKEKGKSQYFFYQDKEQGKRT